MARTIYDPASLPLRVVSSVFRALGIIITAWRIYFRLRIHRFWWEDAWAAVVMFFCLASLIGEWIYLLTYGSSSIVGFWFYALGTVSTVEATYLSIIFSIIRIFPESRLRRFTFLYGVCSGIFWIVIVAGKIWRCASNPNWQHLQPPVCIIESPVHIIGFIGDCVTVAVLIVIPLRVLWRVKLPKCQRRMILSAFASSVTLAFVAIFHIVGDVLNIDTLIVAGADFQIACAIIVCNLLVVVTYVYRSFWRDGDTTTTSESDVDDFTQPRRHSDGSLMTLTTIEIGSCMTPQDTSQTFMGGTVLTDGRPG